MAEQATIKEKYPHISQGVREMLLSIGATSQQLETSDKNAKANIDSTLAGYLTDIPQVCIVLVGEDGPGKDFIVRALIGENGERSADRTDVKSVIINGLNINVVDTGLLQVKADIMTFVIFVVDSKSRPPTLTKADQAEFKELVSLGQFVVAIGHEEGEHEDPKSQEYLRGWKDYPFYGYMTSDNVVYFNVKSEQPSGLTKQEIICKMLLNATMNSRSSPKHRTTPSSRHNETEDATQGVMNSPGDSLNVDDDEVTFSTVSAESRSSEMANVEPAYKETLSDETVDGDKGDLKNSQINSLGKRTINIANAFSGESEMAQVLEKFEELMLNDWDVVDLEEVIADGQSSARISTKVIAATVQGDMYTPGDTPKADDDVISLDISAKTGSTVMTAVEPPYKETPFDEAVDVDKGDQKNSERNHLGKKTINIANAVPGESEMAQVLEKFEELMLDNWNMVDLKEVMADEPSSARIGTIVIGASGSGKSATANTLLGENKEEPFLEGSSAVSVTTKRAEKSVMVNGVHLTVIDTPGSWETKHTSEEAHSKMVYVFIINIASPRFDLDTLRKLENLKDTEGKIVKSGRFVVALSHADSALQNNTLEEYLEEIKGDPLHAFLTGDAKGKVIALNNAAETEYQRNVHQITLMSRVLLASSKMVTPKPKSWLSRWLSSPWGTGIR